MPDGYERLGVTDKTFLDLERPNEPQHIAAVTVFEAGRLARPDGGIDIERVRAYVASRLHRMPRYRQRLAWIPVENHPVWVDDPHFQIEFHVRHTALPRPGRRAAAEAPGQAACSRSRSTASARSGSSGSSRGSRAASASRSCRRCTTA